MAWGTMRGALGVARYTWLNNQKGITSVHDTEPKYLLSLKI